MSDATETPRKKEGKTQRNILVLLPLVAFLALAGLFFVRLGAGDASRIPSALIGHPAPKTDLPGLTNDSFKGAVTLVNVWASWCVPCRDEVPQLDQLSKDKRVQLAGINYKDAPDNARRFLNRYGNPFAAAGTDENGRNSIDWGVYGVPETFLIGRDGMIVYKLVGPITAENLAKQLGPEIEKALAKN